MNEKFRCTEEEWLELHKKCNGDTLKLTREEMYLYKNDRNAPKKYKVKKHLYHRVFNK